jgi:hypothetical protein
MALVEEDFMLADRLCGISKSETSEVESRKAKS